MALNLTGCESADLPDYWAAVEKLRREMDAELLADFRKPIILTDWHPHPIFTRWKRRAMALLRRYGVT